VIEFAIELRQGEAEPGAGTNADADANHGNRQRELKIVPPHGNAAIAERL